MQKKTAMKTFNSLMCASVLSTTLAMPTALFAQEDSKNSTPQNAASQNIETSFLIKSGSPIDFQDPLVLLGIPVGLLLLNRLLRSRAMQPREQDFGPMFLLRDLESNETVPDSMPLLEKMPWFSALTMAFIAAASPQLNENTPIPYNGPVLIAVDNNWAAAPDWEKRHNAMQHLIRQAHNGNRDVIFLETAEGNDGLDISVSQPMEPASALSYIDNINPVAWNNDLEQATQALEALSTSIGGAYWLSDGLNHEKSGEFLTALDALSNVTIFSDLDTANLMMPADLMNGDYHITIKRADIKFDENLTIVAYDQSARKIGEHDVIFEQNQSELNFIFPKNAYRRPDNNTAKFSIEGELSAGATILASENFRPKPVGIATQGTKTDIGSFVDERFFIYKALSDYTPTHMGRIEELIKQDKTAVLIIPDAVPLSGLESEIEQWVENGGTLIRFAGSNLTSQSYVDDPLIPIDLSAGASTVTDTNQTLSIAEFKGLPNILKDEENSLELLVKRQLIVQPSDEETEKVQAYLSDGSPLITADERGRGRVVLIHTTANTSWSDFAITAQFPEVLKSIVQNSNGITHSADYKISDLDPISTLNARGALGNPSDIVQPLTNDILKNKVLGPNHPPGIYGTELIKFPYNLSDVVTSVEKLAITPSTIQKEDYSVFEQNSKLREQLWAGALALTLLGTALLGRKGFSKNRSLTKSNTPSLTPKVME